MCVAGVCQSAKAPLLSVDALSPQAVVAGRQILTIRGLGFEPGATLRFEDGQGRAPRVRSLRFLDGWTLEADVEVSGKGPKRSRFWDVVVILPDETQARLRDPGLRGRHRRPRLRRERTGRGAQGRPTGRRPHQRRSRRRRRRRTLRGVRGGAFRNYRGSSYLEINSESTISNSSAGSRLFGNITKFVPCALADGISRPSWPKNSVAPPTSWQRDQFVSASDCN